MEQTGICYIVGGGEFDASRFYPRKEDYIIAADSGLVYIEEAGYCPDLIVGDFDSLGYRPKEENMIYHPAEKDDTDLALAAEAALEKGFRKLYLFGVSGGRLDHTLANLQLLTDLCCKGVEVYCFCPDCTITALTEGVLSFTADYRGYVSVFAAGDKVEAVTLQGLKYPLEHEVLTGSRALGVSNEFMGVPATIRVGKGVLWILWQESMDCKLPEMIHEKEEVL